MKKENIQHRLKELYDDYQHLTDVNLIYIKPNNSNGLTRREQIERCKILIKELETLLN
jgi:hypothetical protein